MKKIILIAGLLMLSTAAFATNNHDDEGCRGNCGSTTQPANYDQDQGQSQGQHQGQAQQANAAAGAIAGAASNASNHTAVGVDVDSRNTNTNLVGVDTRDSNVNNNTDFNANNNADFNANNNTAHGGRGGDGGDAYSHGGNQAQQQGISDSGNSSSEASARGGDQEQSITASGNSANSNVNSNRNDSTAINEGNNAAQSTSVTFEAAKMYRNTPDAGAPSIYASGVCSGRSAGIGASGPGYGISLGGTGKNDAGCELRETARVLGGLGYVDTAFVLLCQQVPSVKEANGGHCQIPQEPEPPVVIYPEPEPEPEVPVIVDDIKG